ncbi:MAG TPA: DUF4232 domain-containing protein, partial [Trebonia sp.]
MRARARLGWRVAAALAFGATAALAVSLSRGASVNASLASDKAGGATQQASPGAASSPPAAAVTARCALSGLRIVVGPGTRVTAAVTDYPLDFTNVSGAPCTLAGYPEVAAYRGDDIQVGAAAVNDTSVAARRVLLAPGETAHAALDALVPAARCGPVRASGVRVAPPGQAGARYLPRPLTACAAGASRGVQYLRVHAIQAGPG